MERERGTDSGFLRQQKGETIRLTAENSVKKDLLHLA
jgi:hypothetical protein